MGVMALRRRIQRQRVLMRLDHDLHMYASGGMVCLDFSTVRYFPTGASREQSLGYITNRATIIEYAEELKHWPKIDHADSCSLSGPKPY